MTEVVRFPRTLAAVRKHEKAQWAIGDALLAECRAPSTQGGRDGSYQKLKECAAELAAHGLQYDLTHLARLRSVAHDFPETARRAVSWAAHREAKSPDVLDRIIAAAPAGQTVTRDYVARQVRDGAGREQDAEPPQPRPRQPSSEHGVRLAEKIAELTRCAEVWHASLFDGLDEDQRHEAETDLAQVGSLVDRLWVNFDGAVRMYARAARKFGNEELAAELQPLKRQADARRNEQNRGRDRATRRWWHQRGRPATQVEATADAA